MYHKVKVVRKLKCSESRLGIMLKEKAIYVIAISCGLYWLLHVPIPEECDYPLALKALCTAVEGFKLAASINFILGGNFAGPFSVQDWHPPANDSTLTITYTDFSGVKVAIYKPSGIDEGNTHSAIIFFHGGGFTVGSINSHADLTFTIAKKTGMLVIVPEYRLAPKHPFPAAFDDCLAVTKTFLERAKSYGVNARKVVLMGDSAGGNLAVAVALAIGKDASPNPLCMINLIYPTLQMVNFQLPSYQQNPAAPVLDAWLLMRFILNYIGFGNNTELAPLLWKNAHMESYTRRDVLERVDEKLVPAKYKMKPYPEWIEMVPEEGYETLQANLKEIQDIATDIRLSSLVADDSTLKLLPRTHIVTCEYDPLRDDGIILHQRMQRLGLKSSFVNWEFCAHGIFSSYGAIAYERLDTAAAHMLGRVMEDVKTC